MKRVNAGNATETMKRVVVVYPYNESYYINTDTYNVEASLPASQSYLKDSYGVGGNIMISQSEFNQFSLKSVCGWLKIQLTGNGEKVKSIKLKGNAGEQVAGLIYINSATAEATLAAEMGSADDNENTAGGNLVFDDTILTEVTLDCGEGVELGTEPTAFYIGLPPQTFEKGISLEIVATDYSMMTKSTENDVVIERNHILPMAAFNANFSHNGAYIGEYREVSGAGGVVFCINEDGSGKVVSVQSASYKNWYDADNWCKALGSGGWYMPTYEELSQIGLVKDAINSALSTYGFEEISGEYWSSSDFEGQSSADMVYLKNFDREVNSIANKHNLINYNIRAIHSFKE